MGGYLNKEDRDMIANSLLKHRVKLKKIYDYVSIILFNFIQWGGCFMFTLLLLTSNMLVIGTKKMSESIFTYWDKYMVYVDRKRIIKERTKDNEGVDYLVRYYLFLKGSSGTSSRRFPYNVFLHKF